MPQTWVLRPGETSEHLPSCLPRQFCYALDQNFHSGRSKARLLQRFKVRSLEGLGCEHLPAVRAAGGLLEYLEDTQKENPVPSSRCELHTHGLPDS